MTINTGYTPAGLDRAFDVTREQLEGLFDGLTHLDCDEGERPFSVVHAVFSYAAVILFELGWTPDELSEHINNLNNNDRKKGTM